MGIGGGGGYMYYQDSQQEKAILISEAAVRDTKIALQNEAIAQADRDREKIQQVVNNLNQRFAQSQKDYDNLVSRFGKLSSNFGTRDIGKLAENKPKLIERVISRASARALRCFEILSGSPLTNKELTATKPSQINTECPSVANPNYHPKED
jgi:glutamine synthetase adenylyltransferase